MDPPAKTAVAMPLTTIRLDPSNWVAVSSRGIKSYRKIVHHGGF